MPRGVYARAGRGRHDAVKGHQGFPAKLDTLEESEQQQVVQWLGEFRHPGRIPAMIQEVFGKRVADNFGYLFQKRQKWAARIDQARQHWLLKTFEIPLAHQKYRLSRLQQQLDALDLQQLRESVSAREYRNELFQILDRARRETAEQPIEQHTWFFQNVNLNTLTDEELQREKEALLKRIQQFHLPIRRLTNGMGRSEGNAAAGRGDSEDDG